ncbi:MAG: PAS domain S-box protein [Anaerolineales bacterium]|nr:PAS domain S-box protein [Anaerolineales bacterium]
MQNEELVQARAEADAVHREYSELYDFAPVGYFTLARDGAISKVNVAGTTLLGVVRNELLTRRFGLFVSPLSRPAFVTFLEKVFSANGKKQTCEVELLCRGKTESLWAQIEAACDDAYETCRAVVVDISERKQNQAKVNFQAGLLEAVGQAVIATDLAGTVIYFNRAAEALYGWPVAEALGRNILEINVPALSQAEAVEIMQQLNAGKTWSGEFLVQRRDGTVFPAHVSDSPVVDEAGQLIAIIGISSDISERKHAEAQIRAITERLKFATASAKAGVWDWNLQTNEMIWDDRMYELYGLTHENFPGGVEAWKQGLHPEDASRAIQECEAALTGERDFDTEFRVRKPDGSVVYIKANGLVLWDEQGKLLRMIGLNIDITKHKQAEEALRESKVKLQDVFNLMQEGMALNELVFDEQGEIVDYRILEVNPAYERISTLTREQVVGKKATEIYGMSSAYIKEFWEQNQHDVHTIITEYYVPQTNQWRTISTSAPVDNKFTTMFSDITDRKLAEDALRESADLLEKTIFSLLDAVLIINADTVKIVNCNPAASAIFGYSRQEMLGQTTLFLHVNQASLDEFRQHLYSDMEAGKDFMFLPEFKMKRKDGTVFISEHSVVPLINKQGRRTGWVSVVRDITERKRAEEEIRQLNVNLEQRVKERTAELVRANHIKDEFMANMSHELRTPLNGILGNSEILLEGVHGSINPKQSQSVETIYSSGQHLLDLINDILDVSKIEAGKFELHPESISVQLICRSSLTFIKQLALKKSIKVEYNPSPSAPAIFADPIRLKQILVNLLSNAVKFTPENGSVKLEVQEDTPARQIRFSITDNGIGISPEDQQKLFKSFVQLDSGLARQHEGSGLGLALVRQLVEMHGGSVGVKASLAKAVVSILQFPPAQPKYKPKINYQRS